MAHEFVQASGAYFHDSEQWRRELHDIDNGPAVIKTRFPEIRKTDDQSKRNPFRK